MTVRNSGNCGHAPPFSVLRKVDLENSRDEDLMAWLDERFQLQVVEQNQPPRASGLMSPMCHVREWGAKMRQNCPEMSAQALFYVRDNTTSYGHQNYTGRIAIEYVWPLFFERFPLGQVWVVEIPQDWVYSAWDAQRAIADKTGFLDKYPQWQAPQAATGLQSDHFPFAAMDLLAYGIYPLVLCAYTYTAFNVVFLYIPDRAFEHGQMTEGDTLYQRVLFSMHHVFDDQWTFDGARGPKSGACAGFLNPIANVGYFEWLIDNVGKRMADIADISDPWKREQLGMTINRAIYDAVLCVVNQFPYTVKMFFFECLDKLSNFMKQIGEASDEFEAWKRLVDVDFLRGELTESIGQIPGAAGEHFRRVVDRAAEELEIDNLSPQDLRDMRNSHHGYRLLQRGAWERLMTRTGELNNDITLIVTPLLLYALNMTWNVE